MVLNDLPRNVFTTCAKDREQVPVPKVEFKIMGESDQLIMLVENQVTFADVQKAAKCIKLKSFTIRKYGLVWNDDSALLSAADFPIKANLILKKFVPSTPTLISTIEYAIIRSSDNSVIQIELGGITKASLDRAAKCAGIKRNYTASKYKVGKALVVNNDTMFKHNVFIRRAITKHDPVFHICESTSVTPVKKSKSLPIVVGPSKQSAKQKLINVAIEGLQHAITALKNLEKII